MDFAALMSAEISKNRPSKSSTLKSSTSISKYVKRADLEAQRLDGYKKEQEDIKAAREAASSKKRKLEEEEATKARERDEKRRRLADESRIRREEEEAKEERARRKRLGLPEIPPSNANGDKDDAVPEAEDISEAELLTKLRSLAVPAILFGETHKQRLRRYRALTIVAPVMTNGPIPTTLELVPEEEMAVPAKPPPAGTEERKLLFRQLASYFTLLLTEWQRALAGREASVVESFQGKQAYNAMVQSTDNLRPLFRKFESGDLQDSILEPVVEIVGSAQKRRYVDANDGYLRLSIGKAAWPIGVTMVGIHERSAREKLHESDKAKGQSAHIMSDEVTRRYLQAIKRCLSFAQVRWPPEEMGQLMG
ncbi:mRNA splicing protein prp18 [Agyrium rufum]|nr:mRNA splicing protein prp18 [Agyrium rufum]